jgi:ferredoxin-NADP reductase
MSEPMGDFVLPKDILRPLVFVAGGIGITPIRSMIKWLFDSQQHRTIHLLYAAQTVDDLAFRKLFNDYGLPTDLVLQSPPLKWEEYSGKLDGNQVLELAPDVDDKLYYLSGPEPMVETLEKELIDLGVNKQRIVGDFFPNYTRI